MTAPLFFNFLIKLACSPRVYCLCSYAKRSNKHGNHANKGKPPRRTVIQGQTKHDRPSDGGRRNHADVAACGELNTV